MEDQVEDCGTALRSARTRDWQAVLVCLCAMLRLPSSSPAVVYPVYSGLPMPSHRPLRDRRKPFSRIHPLHFAQLASLESTPVRIPNIIVLHPRRPLGVLSIFRPSPCLVHLLLPLSDKLDRGHSSPFARNLRLDPQSPGSTQAHNSHNPANFRISACHSSDFVRFLEQCLWTLPVDNVALCRHRRARVRKQSTQRRSVLSSSLDHCSSRRLLLLHI